VIEILSKEAVKDINEDKRSIPQMQVFNDPKYLFLYDQKLTFDWIEKYGLNIELVADDLVALAIKYGFDNHEIDQTEKAEMQN